LKFNSILIFLLYKQNFYGDWGLGIGDWGLGIGPNTQNPIPKTQCKFLKLNNKK